MKKPLSKEEKEAQKAEKEIRKREKREAYKKAHPDNIFVQFKKFISRGNVIDMAVGVIIAGAFTAIVTALVQKIFMPLITWAIPGGITGLTTNLNPMLNPDGSVMLDASGAIVYNKIEWGVFINAVITFVLVALILFAILKIIMFIRGRKDAMMSAIKKRTTNTIDEVSEPEAAAPAPVPTPEERTEALLIEIRDLLKAQQKDKTKK